MNKTPRELVAASSKPLALSILARGDSYGYEIIQEVRSRSEGQLTWTDGMLYPVLHRLEKDGLITSFWKKVGHWPGSEVLPDQASWQESHRTT